MTDRPIINGHCPDRFSAVREVFSSHFSAGEEIGARFALADRGQIMIDLYAGHADRARTRPFDQQTLTPVFSTTKLMAALMIARLVDQGHLAYDQRVSSIWPAFAAEGKGAITIAQILSHQAGLCGIAEEFDPALWFDWDAICGKLAAMAPLWEPGTASGYHPITVGYLVGEIFRRVDGRTLGSALREDIAEPHDLDLWIGLPEREHGRCAEMQRPMGLANLGEMTQPRRLAFGTRWSAPSGRETAQWRQCEIPSGNGHATAPALARIMALLADDGQLDGQALLSPGTAAEVMQERISGPDLVLPRRVSWAAGPMRNSVDPAFGPSASIVGHYGWGGSCAFADPATGLSGAYVMTRQSTHLVADPRATALIQAVYGCL
jgi:CubicO group peptidase (beta-lactamase class C family)